MQPATSSLPQHTTHTINHTVDGSYFQHFLLSLFACWVAINFLAPSTFHGVRSPSPPLPSIPDHKPTDPIFPPSGPTAGDLAAYNLFSYSESRLVTAIRGAPAGTSVKVAHEMSVALWGTTLPVPPLIVLVSIRLAQLERGGPYLMYRPALQQVWAVAGVEGTKEDMTLALAGKLKGGPSFERTVAEEGSQVAIREDLERLEAKLDRLAEVDKLSGP